MEIKTKDQEIKASETRLLNMEQDLIEMSMTNDEYRSQVHTTQCKKLCFGAQSFTSLKADLCQDIN